MVLAPLVDRHPEQDEDAEVRDIVGRLWRECAATAAALGSTPLRNLGTPIPHVLFGCVDATCSGVVKVNSMRLWVFFPRYDFRYGQLIGESCSYCPAACLLNIRNSVLLGDPTRVVSLTLAQFIRRLIATVTATAANQQGANRDARSNADVHLCPPQESLHTLATVPEFG